MTQTTDVVVLGGGTIGLSAAYHAAQRGLKTVLVDQYPAPGSGGPNDHGSSRGLERMFRILYAQTERVRLVESAYAMWHEMQQQVGGDPILLEQDMLFFGNPDVTTFEGNLGDIRTSMNELGIPFDDLKDPDAIAERYPIFQRDALQTPDGTPYQGLVQNNGATIDVQRAFQVLRGLAERTGSYSFLQGRVAGFRQTDGAGWRVTLADGQAIEAGYLIVCPGMWLPGALAPFGLRPYRDPSTQVAWSIWQMTLAYYDPGPAGQGASWPIWYEFGNTDTDDRRLFYGFPDVSLTPDTAGKLKISADYTNVTFPKADDVRREPDERILSDIQSHLDQLLQPGVLETADPQLAQTCMYSMAPDGDMVIGRVPVAPESTQYWPNASIFCMASGRGFKYTPIFGRILVDLAVKGATAYAPDLQDFSTSRAQIFQGLRG